jgi:hypothetical protein
MSAGVGERPVPFLTSRAVGRGRILVMNVRTFSEDDFGKAGEYLLAPKALGLPKIPQLVADILHAVYFITCVLGNSWKFQVSNEARAAAWL